MSNQQKLSPEDKATQFSLLKYGRDKTPLSRAFLLTILGDLGFKVPRSGKIVDLCTKEDSTEWCIVWLGRQSSLMTLNEAYNKWPSNYGVMFIGGKDLKPSKSTRYIQIGSSAYWVDITSANDWQSTKGETQSHLSRVVTNEYHPLIKLPVFSIDFIESDITYAIDFDANPGIRGTGIDKITDRKEAVELIKKAAKHFGVP